MTQVARALEDQTIQLMKHALLNIQAAFNILAPRKPPHRCGPLRTRKARGKARTRRREADRRFKRQLRDLGLARGYMLFSQAHWEHFGKSPHDDMTKKGHVRREFERTHVVHYEPGRLTISARSTNQNGK